jgi:hypothetical protein
MLTIGRLLTAACRKCPLLKSKMTSARRSSVVNGRQLKPVTKTDSERRGRKRELRESESDKAGAKQDETSNGHGEEAL